MGGAWEQMIRSVRRILSITLKGQVLTDDTLQTIIIEIEAIVISRPLIPITFDPKDDEPLTPTICFCCEGSFLFHLEYMIKRTAMLGAVGRKFIICLINFGDDLFGNICQIYNRDKSGFKPKEASNKTILFFSLVTYCQEVNSASAELKRHFQTKRV